MSKIVNYQISKLDIPLKRPLVTSSRSSKSLKGILFKIELDDGSIGLGESAENIKLTGENREEMSRFARDFFEEHLQENVDDVLLMLQGFVNHNAARSGMETAILDAVSHSNGTEIVEEFGIPVHTRTIENDTTISLMDSEQTVAETMRVLDEGYKHIKYKLNDQPGELERILQLEEIMPDDVSIRIDPEQSWNYQQTIEAMQEFDNSPLKIEFIEQPVPILLHDEMKQLTTKATIPIIADEAVFNLQDAKDVIKHGYGTAINIKLIKCGGPLEAIEIANYAKRKNVDCLFGCTTEANVALTTAAYLSAGLSNVKYIDLDGLDYLSDTPFNGGVTNHDGLIDLPEQTNGLGIELVETKLDQYVTDFVTE